MPTPSGFSAGHAFEHARGNADLVQAERQRQPADAAAGDEYGHDVPSTPSFMSWHGTAAVGNRESRPALTGMDGGTPHR